VLECCHSENPSLHYSITPVFQPKVRRLFANPRQVETDHFHRTGIFPIMHVVIIRQEFYQRHPWVAQSLNKALLDAKNHCIAAMFKNDAIHSVVPWAANHAGDVQK